MSTDRCGCSKSNADGTLHRLKASSSSVPSLCLTPFLSLFLFWTISLCISFCWSTPTCTNGIFQWWTPFRWRILIIYIGPFLDTALNAHFSAHFPLNTSVKSFGRIGYCYISCLEYVDANRDSDTEIQARWTSLQRISWLQLYNIIEQLSSCIRTYLFVNTSVYTGNSVFMKIPINSEKGSYPTRAPECG